MKRTFRGSINLVLSTILACLLVLLLGNPASAQDGYVSNGDATPGFEGDPCNGHDLYAQFLLYKGEETWFIGECIRDSSGTVTEIRRSEAVTFDYKSHVVRSFWEVRIDRQLAQRFPGRVFPFQRNRPTETNVSWNSNTFTLLEPVEVLVYDGGRKGGLEVNDNSLKMWSYGIASPHILVTTYGQRGVVGPEAPQRK